MVIKFLEVSLSIFQILGEEQNIYIYFFTLGFQLKVISAWKNNVCCRNWLIFVLDNNKIHTEKFLHAIFNQQVQLCFWLFLFGRPKMPSNAFSWYTINSRFSLKYFVHFWYNFIVFIPLLTQSTATSTRVWSTSTGWWWSISWGLPWSYSPSPWQQWCPDWTSSYLWLDPLEAPLWPWSGLQSLIPSLLINNVLGSINNLWFLALFCWKIYETFWHETLIFLI